MTEENKNNSIGAERAGIALKVSIFAVIFAAAMTVLTLVTGLGTGWSGLGTFTLAAIPFAVAALFGIASAAFSMFAGNAAEEDYEKEMLRKRKESVQSIMDVSEDVRFTANRTFRNYVKYAPGVFALLGILFIGGGLWGAYARYQQVSSAGLPLPKEPLALAFVCVLAAAFSLFSGVFMVGQSRIREFRWLRPSGAWLIFSAATLFFAAIPAVCQNYGHVGFELPFAKIVYVILAVLAVEFLFSFIAEFYRPRTRLEDRPVHESRILALFIEPGSVARNLAEAIDYQFGFKVSGTWLFRVFCRVAIPVFFAWMLVLWLFTGIAEVGPGELGFRTRFGKLAVDEKCHYLILKPGAYLKLPWPCEEIIRIKIDEPQTVILGAAKAKKPTSAADKKKTETILWTSQHSEGEAPFLVANNSSSSDIGNAVSVLNATLPVVYKVNPDRISDYVFNYRSISTYLQNIGMREATIYFASTDFISDMSVGREQITRVLKDRIQKMSDRAKLGITILTVDLVDTHPPVENVAPAFQDVFCAQEEKNAAIEKARSYAITTLASAKIDADRLLSNAEADKFNVTQVSASEAAQFKSKLAAYRAMPSMYRLRTYLWFLENDCAALRKYVVSSAIPYQIIELNAEEKPRMDLLDADLSGDIK